MIKSRKNRITMSKRNENRPGYKKSKAGWIPDKWESNGFSAIAKIEMGQSPNGKSYNTEGIGYPLINGPTEFTERYPIKKQWTSSPTKICNSGDILLCVRGSSTGRMNIANDKYCIGRGVAAICHKDKKSYSIFIEQLLISITTRILTLTTGSTFPNIDKNTLSSIPVGVPPLPEQEKIAEILSAWNRAIEQVGKLIDAKQRLKKGLMQQLLTGRMRFPEFDHGIHGIHGKKKDELPEGWKNKTLGSFGLFSKGKGISNSEKRGTGFPCITYGEIYTRHEFVIKEFHSFIDKDTAQKSQRIQKGDIIFAGSGETLDEIGKCVAYTQDEEAYAGGDIIIFRPKGVDSVYVSYLLNSDLLIRQKRKLGQGYSVVHIYSSGLKILHVPLPSLPEQTRIASVLSTCDREIELLRRKEIALREQKKGLMQKLLTGKVRHPEFLKEGRA